MLKAKNMDACTVEMGFDDQGLPIGHVLAEVALALRDAGRVVLQAPPGAGKTTLVPLYLLSKDLVQGRILMLEPRRMAARAAAERMADLLGSPLGSIVGYRVRGESRISAATRIEVVTEGILTRMIQSDPELKGVGCVIFDEFHERSLQADLGLALCLEIRGALRPDLKLIVMSATLDAGAVAELMGNAAVITSLGRNFPVETHWLERPWVRPRFEEALASLVRRALAETEGGILAFLPGEGEIRRVEARLADCGAEVVVLFGTLPFAKQRAALVEGAARRVVLATSIAETSLTLPGIRVVVDGGLARRSQFDPGSGMTSLVTERVTKAEADQRRGRAGRLAAGVCYRLWTKGEEGGMAAFPLPEIAAADLAPLALEMALWGSDDLPFLTKPPAPMLEAARGLLRSLGALEGASITRHGRALVAMPVHPRLGHMILAGGGVRTAQMAALLEERDLLQRDAGADLALRMAAIAGVTGFEADHPHRVDRAVLARVSLEAKRLRRFVGPDRGLSDGALLALAYPDRIGQRRTGDAARYLLAGGKGALVAEGDALGRSPMLVAANLDGDGREAKVRLGMAVEQREIRAVFADEIRRENHCEWSRRDKAVVAVERVMLGALVLEERLWGKASGEAIAAAMVQGVAELGLEVLPWNDAARGLAARVEWVRRHGGDMTDMSAKGLLANLGAWLHPHLGGCRKLSDLARLDLRGLLEARLGWAGLKELDRFAPEAIFAPTGTRLVLDYSGDVPKVTVRMQEMFGTGSHPVVGPNRMAVLFELVSPAGKPVQLTTDLPGFWATSYADVRRDMRGRYPKHPWPEDPGVAEPTRRVKPRS